MCLSAGLAPNRAASLRRIVLRELHLALQDQEDADRLPSMFCYQVAASIEECLQVRAPGLNAQAPTLTSVRQSTRRLP